MNVKQILAELRNERTRIDEAIAALENLSPGMSRNSTRADGQRKAVRTRKRRRMSVAARKRISDMMKARWAARKKKAKAA